MTFLTMKKTGRLRLKGASLLQMGKGKENPQNPHELSRWARISSPTASKYVDNPDAMKQIDLEVLPAILIDGLDFTADEMMNLRLKDLFEYVEDDTE